MRARVWWVTKSANRILVRTVIEPLSDDLVFSFVPPPPYVAASARTFASNHDFLPCDEADKDNRLRCTSDGTLSRREIERNTKGTATRFQFRRCAERDPTDLRQLPAWPALAHASMTFADTSGVKPHESH